MEETETRTILYRLAPEKSRFTVQAFATGLLQAFGHDPVIAIRDFEGEVEMVPGTLSQASVRMKINTDSLGVTDSVKEKDRAEVERMMREEVLETATYPEIVFESASVNTSRVRPGQYRARIIGNLTMHGTTQQNLWIHAEVKFEDERLRAQGEFTLKQSDFKIKPVSVAGGAMKVKDELKFSFDIVAEKSEGEEGASPVGEVTAAQAP